MEKYRKYSKINEKNDDGFYRFILSDIQINVKNIIKEFKEKYNISCWYLYNSKNSVSLEYFQSSNDSEENIDDINKFLFEALPYFKGMSCYIDDRRLVLRFLDVGEPIQFKFYR